MIEWTQQVSRITSFFFGLCSNIPTLSSVDREVQEDWPYFLEAEDFLKIVWEWKAESDFFFFFCRMETFYPDKFFFIVYFYIVSNPLISSFPKIHFQIACLKLIYFP